MPRGIYERTPEHNVAMSEIKKNSAAAKAAAEAQKGVPLSPEHCAAMSLARRNSDAVKAANDTMRGGNDLVKHHYIYDHNNLSLNTVQMVRSDHMKLHKLLQKLGYIVPHILKKTKGEYNDKR